MGIESQFVTVLYTYASPISVLGSVRMLLASVWAAVLAEPTPAVYSESSTSSQDALGPMLASQMYPVSASFFCSVTEETRKENEVGMRF
jgi:hypothetical protein